MYSTSASPASQGYPALASSPAAYDQQQQLVRQELNESLEAALAKRRELIRCTASLKLKASV